MREVLVRLQKRDINLKTARKTIRKAIIEINKKRDEKGIPLLANDDINRLIREVGLGRYFVW